MVLCSILLTESVRTCIEVMAIISLVERDAHLRQYVCRCATRTILSAEQSARCSARLVVYAISSVISACIVTPF